jgi:hypothetical protein
MKQILLATTAAVALAFGAYGAAAQSDPTDHQQATPGTTQPHQAAKAGRTQNPPPAVQPQNPPGMPRQTLSQQDHHQQGVSGTPVQPNQAQDTPSAAQPPNQPAAAQHPLSQHEHRAQGIAGGPTQPGQAQPHQTQSGQAQSGRAQPHQAQSGQAQNAPSSTQSQNQPGTAQSRLSRDQRQRLEQGFAGSTAAPPANGHNRTAEGVVNTTVPIPEERRAELTQRFESANLRRVDRVDFSLRVGTVVPRGAPLYPLPPDIVSVYPAFRGYEYIAVGDRIAIVEPRTMKIVTVIDQRRIREGFAGSTAPPRGALAIPERERVLIRERLRTVAAHQCRDANFPIRIGAFVPPSVPLEPMPPQLAAVDPDLRRYDYVIVKGEFVVVDPQVRRIVAVIPT